MSSPEVNDPKNSEFPAQALNTDKQAALPGRGNIDLMALSTEPVVQYVAFVIRQWSFRVTADGNDKAMIRVSPRPTEDFDAFVQELETVLKTTPFDDYPGKFSLTPITEGPRFNHHVCVSFELDLNNADLQIGTNALSVAKNWLVNERFQFEEKLSGRGHPYFTLTADDSVLQQLHETSPKILAMKCPDSPGIEQF